MHNQEFLLVEDEQQLLASIEAGEWEAENLTEEELIQIQKNASYTKSLLEQKPTVLNLTAQDLAKLKAKGVELGIGYQNIIKALVHNYLNGEITLKI